MTKATKDKLISQINLANERLEESRQNVCTFFKDPIVTAATDPLVLAKKLSEVFKNVSFSIEYEAGKQAVYAKPRRVAFSTEQEYNLEVNAENAAKLAAKSEIWPHFEEISAYARGFVAGSFMVEAIRDEIKQLRDQAKGAYHVNYMTHPYCMGMR